MTETDARTWTSEQLTTVREFQKIKKTDLYGVLNVERTATEVDLKKAYRKRALEFHPDKNSAPGADEAFKTIGTAFTVLSDPVKRKQYDQYGEDVLQGGGAGSGGPFGGMHRPQGQAHFFQTGGQGMDPADLFSFLFQEFAQPQFHGGGFQQMHFNFGGGGGGPRFRRAQHPFRQAPPTAQEQAERQRRQQASLWTQMMPILILLFLSFLNQLFFGR